MKSQQVSSERWNSILEKAIFWCMLAFVFFVPLLVHPSIYDAIQLPKVTFVRSMGVILVALWMARLLLFSKIEITRTHLDKYVLVFLGLIALSTVFSVHPLTSLLGWYLRYEGLFTFLSYGLLFFLGVQSFSGRRLKALAVIAVCSASLASIYGLSQYFGYDPVAWGGTVETHRGFSTFGDSILFGSFLSLVFPVATGLFLDSSERKEEFLSGAALFLIFFALLTTFSRGAWLAALIGTVLFFVVVLRAERVKRRKIVIVVVIVVIVMASVELLYYTTNVRSYELGYRAASSLNRQQSSVRHRLLIWQIAFKGVRERPILGYGPDTFAFIFYKFETAEHFKQFFLTGQPFAVADNAHNYVVQLLTTLGIPAGLLVVLFLPLFFVAGLKTIYATKDTRSVKIGLLAGLVSYTIALFFGISTAGAASLFWLFLGALMSGNSWESEIRWTERSYVPRIILYVLVFILGLVATFLNLRLFGADAHFARALSLEKRGAYAEAVQDYHSAVRLNPWESRYRGELGLNYFNWAQEAGNNKQLVDVAAFHLEKAKEISPLLLDNYLILGNLYRFGGMFFDEKYYTLAERSLRQAIRISPNSAGAHYLLGFVYVLEGRNRLANAELARAKKISPNYQPNYLSLGEYFESRGEIERAREMYLRAVKQKMKGAKEALERIERKSE